MAGENRLPEVFRFGTFAVDVRSGELRKHGVRVKIQEQPFRLLALLLLRSGEVVTRDELRTQIWQADTFVDFDNGLNTSINRLREALGDSANNPRFIETLPRRGYRFIAEVNATDIEIPVSENGRSIRHPHRRTFLIAIVVFALIAGGGLLWRWRQVHRLTETDTIVVADFVNTTGDSVFDGALRRGLSVQLEQSPFLNLLSEQKIQQTLRLMKQPAAAKLTPEIAREVCERTSTTIALDGSISQIGTEYSLILRAVSCSDDKLITSTQAYAKDKKHVLEALGTASYDIRRKLGESLATVQKYDTPLVQATTSSLEALKVYSLGYKALTGNGDSAAAVPLLQQATKLDPNFAMAYVLLGASYWNLGENTAASQCIRKAFELRGGLSEAEKLRIESEYHCLVTCNL
jgi:DNA-binding winged helix-turn-helix (wHTH) protein